MKYNQPYKEGNVKITMIDNFLRLIAPHHCCSCGQIGTLLCSDCKYDITVESLDQCILCQRPSLRGICKNHHTAYDKAWFVGTRRDSLQRLIGGYKFQNVKSAYKPLAELLDKKLPDLPDDVVLVPIPTVSSHIRERGYDHTLLVTRQLAKIRKLQIINMFTRFTNSTQRHTNRQTRDHQASNAFNLQKDIDPTKTYLIVDDVVTTGSTIKHASELLKKSGAMNIWVAAIARQPLD